MAIWRALQIAAVLVALTAGDGLSLNPIWIKGIQAGIGRLVSQLFGTAPAEESLFRGILLIRAFFMVQEKTDAKLDGEFLRSQYRCGYLVAFYQPRCRAVRREWLPCRVPCRAHRRS